MKRYLENYIRQDLNEKIVLLSGPRQVGKTTLSKQLIPSHVYLNYDAASDRRVIGAQKWDRDTKPVVFDEIHKMKRWKSWIKGIYDTGAVGGDLGAKLENTVAGALLRELHLSEDTTGSRVALHYLRDKEKREVDFLAVIDNRPRCMIEVKVSDDRFSPSVFRFYGNLKGAKPFQLVYSLKRKKSKDSARMLPVHEFLRDLQL